MSKPINVEGQRVFKLLNETIGKHYSTATNFYIDKIKVLSVLNCEFFEEIYKKEEEELGKLNFNH